MIRATVLALALAAAGCGDDMSMTSGDMAVAADLAGARVACGVDGISLSCGGVSAGVSCYVCDYTGGSGHCARPCKLASPSCPSQHCIDFNGDGGTPADFAVEGNGCAGYGFCR